MASPWDVEDHRPPRFRVPTAVYAASVAVFVFLALKALDGLASAGADNAAGAAPAQAKAHVPRSATEVYYSGCREARAAGAAPIYAGEPGYREGLDGDHDGIACEPYHGR
ncbi:MAG TPA: excalibur calcium-binding domain-containing protein [Caulobacterales bacterium]|nr:excalibur calcium-binding domain-containing protein [Caulobacterales bacterium]